jgi:uncharacterized protein
MRRKIVGVIIFCCFIMAFIDGILQPPYSIKSIIKLLLFGSIPFIFFSFSKSSIRSYYQLRKKSVVVALILGFSLYFLIVIGYFVVKPYIDFSNITTTLEQTMRVNNNNFIYVALYISFINSFLEEFFFRGFAFFYFKQYTSRTVAYLFSALSFSLYHTAMMIGWFSPFIFSLSLLALLAAGLLFNWLDEKYASIYPSWLVHLFANLGINTIGLLLF